MVTNLTAADDFSNFQINGELARAPDDNLDFWLK